MLCSKCNNQMQLLFTSWYCACADKSNTQSPPVKYVGRLVHTVCGNTAAMLLTNLAVGQLLKASYVFQKNHTPLDHSPFLCDTCNLPVNGLTITIINKTYSEYC